MNKTDEIIYGRNAVIEAIKSGMPINKILISSGEISGSLKIILNFAKEPNPGVFERVRDILLATSYTKKTS